VCHSAQVLPEYKEYERGIATWLNAWLGPIVQRYLTHLARAVSPSPLAIMQSTGGTIDAEQAGQRAVNLLLSGPAGGLSAAKFIGEVINNPRLLTFDMGGTSTDVALIENQLRITNEGRLGVWPVAVPMVDMHTIGAGGGSIAQLDSGGLLQVGPQSAGASPGPACYGQSGQHATVTDANAVLGRLRPDNFLGGAMHLDLAAAESAIDTLAKPAGLTREQMALGIITIANEHMARALRGMSVQRGYDPAQFRRWCFGGAGGLHVCALADSLGMKKAVVPQFGGVLSALGMLVAPHERHLSQTHQVPLRQLSNEQIQHWLQQLQTDGINELLAEGITADCINTQPSLDCRYLGQSYTVNVPYTSLAESEALFHRQHQLLYGHRLERDVELVTIRQRVFSPPTDIQLPTLEVKTGNEKITEADLYAIGGTTVLNRDKLCAGTIINGPALICETVATTLVAKEWQATVDQFGNLLLQRH